MIIKYLLFAVGILPVTLNGDDPCAKNCAYSYIEGGGSKLVDQKFILQKHNDLRKLIAKGSVPNQPKGINLKKMKWDFKLANKAQEIADTCIYKHVEVKDKRWSIGVGQNLYRSRSTALDKKTDWDRAIQAWFEEHKMYSYGTRSIPGTGHYTQLVWATSEYLGCAYAFFETKEQMKYQKYYVCNYGPGGNVLRHTPYETGQKGCENLC